VISSSGASRVPKSSRLLPYRTSLAAGSGLHDDPIRVTLFEACLNIESRRWIIHAIRKDTTAPSKAPRSCPVAPNHKTARIVQVRDQDESDNRLLLLDDEGVFVEPDRALELAVLFQGARGWTRQSVAS
jgi:hypothetical protein